MRKTGIRNGASNPCRFSYSALSPWSQRSPVTTATSGRGSSAFSTATALARCAAVSISIDTRSLPGGGPVTGARKIAPCARMCGSESCATSMLRVPLGQHENPLLGEEIGKRPTRIERERTAIAVERDAFLDAHADLVTQRDEITDRAEMDVGRIVPLMIEQPRYRHAAAQRQAGANPPEAEIGKRHDRPLADPHQRFEHAARLARRLQCLAQYDDIERPGRIGVEIAVGIALDH